MNSSFDNCQRFVCVLFYGQHFWIVTCTLKIILSSQKTCPPLSTYWIFLFANNWFLANLYFVIVIFLTDTLVFSYCRTNPSQYTEKSLKANNHQLGNCYFNVGERKCLASSLHAMKRTPSYATVLHLLSGPSAGSSLDSGCDPRSLTSLSSWAQLCTTQHKNRQPWFLFTLPAVDRGDRRRDHSTGRPT